MRNIVGLQIYRCPLLLVVFVLKYSCGDYLFMLKCCMWCVSGIYFITVILQSELYLYCYSVLSFFQSFPLSDIRHLQHYIYYSSKLSIIKASLETENTSAQSFVCPNYYITWGWMFSGRLTVWAVRSQSSTDGFLLKCIQNIIIHVVSMCISCSTMETT